MTAATSTRVYARPARGATGFHEFAISGPPWGVDRITDDGREMMSALGFNL
jgi:hypothetical protein